MHPKSTTARSQGAEETLPEIHKKVAEALKELADLLCPGHPHTVSVRDLPPRVELPYYTLEIPCCGNDIAWEIDMFPNRYLKEIRRCKIIDAPNPPPDVKLLQPRLVWGKWCCNEIVEMIRDSKKDGIEGSWWLNEDMLKDNQPVDAVPGHKQGAAKGDAGVEKKASEIGKPECPTANLAACSAKVPEDSRQLPTTKSSVSER
ncbi:hypothetical protein L873DRAFT_1814519 [Choiromyces venosus 120613-1]|uniref:Uncharacterized protein n=1 Tax=Choiromyces venosus 120613-1 TaxID=1336337 RepID=A0A3N4J7U8_9PEZI|nr:hypothetical protein L873DRAFT_1814519 [Choiromyces venosus 120613-1]